jgi:hypothetical protein
MIKRAFHPKRLKRSIVIVRFAQGLASRNETTEGFEAPFLCSWMEMAKIPCEHTLIINPSSTE